ncbi:MAG: hypothetical protein D6731_12890, partial [Planctomycetota bacterium]
MPRRPTPFVLCFVVALAGCGGHDGRTGPYSTAPAATSAPVASSAASAARAGTAPAPSPPAAPTAPAYTVAAWMPHWTLSASDRSIAANVGDGLDEVCPFGTGLQPDGSLRRVRAVTDPARVAEVRARGGEVLLTVYDVHDRSALASVLADPAARARAIREMVDLVVSEGLDGLDVDFENSRGATRDAFSDFIEDLAAAMRARGKIFSLTLPGKWRDLPSWAGYDYARLGRTADRYKLMCYGYSGAWGGPGPLAPTHWIEKVLDYATQHMPPERIWVGIPFYGTDWPDDGSAVRSRSFARLRDDYLPRASGPVVFEPAQGESHFSYEENGVRHEVWFSDARAVAAKAAVAKRY